MTMVAEYSGLALLIPCAAFVGYAIGHYLDKWLGTGFMTVIFLLLGIAAGLIKVVQQVQKDTGGGDGNAG